MRVTQLATVLLILIAGGAVMYQASRVVRREGLLPLRRARYHLSQSLPAHTRSASIPEPPRRSEQAPLWGRTLVAHPDATVRRFATLVLSGAGAEVTTVAEPKELIASLRHANYDAVIVNAGLSGECAAVDVYRWLQMNQREGIRRLLIAVAEEDEAEARQLSQQTGALCILTPFGASDLVAMTRLVLERAERQG